MSTLSTDQPPRRSLLDDGMWVALGQVGSLVARLIGLRLLTEIFATDVFGTASVMLAFMALALATACNPLVQALMRALPAATGAEDEVRLRRVGMRMLWPCLGAQALVLVVLLLASSELDLQHSPYALLGLLAFTWAETVRCFETGLLTARGDQRRYAIWNLTDAWARPLGALLLAALLAPSVATMLWGYALATALLLPAFRHWRVGVSSGDGAADSDCQHRRAADLVQRGHLLRYALTLVPLAPIAWLLAGADRVLLVAYAGAAATGVFVSACGLGSAPMIALSMSLLTVFRPLLYRSISSGDAIGERRLLLCWIVSHVCIAAAGLALITWLAPTVVRWFLGEEFRGAAELIPWIAGAFALQGLQVVFETRIMAWQCNQRLWLLQLLGGACALVLYLALIPGQGAFGAVLSMLVSMAIACVVAVLLAQRPPVARAAI